MNHQNYQLKRGTGLVIVGPQGCGKTMLAVNIASKCGRFRSIESGQGFDIELRDALNSKAEVIIVEGMPSMHEMGQLKALITTSTMMIRAYFGLLRRTRPTPHIIICVHDADWFAPGNRRFDVIDLSREVAHA